MKNRIINLYIFREIASYFLLGITVFTMLLLMGRLIKLTEMVISSALPLSDVIWMILYLMPSFLVFTVPMAFLLSVLLAFGRLSADNEITVLKSGGISLLQLMPPVIVAAVCATLIGLAASVFAAPFGNRAFGQLTKSALTRNISATMQEKVFWDTIPGIVMYTDHYDDKQQNLVGVLIFDGRDQSRPLTIFAESGVVQSGAGGRGITLSLNRGTIHSSSQNSEYRLVNFGQYRMNIATERQESKANFSLLDISTSQLISATALKSTPEILRLKLNAELHGRFSLPFASLVFALVAVPLGIQNRRSGKSAGFAISIGLLLCYYILLSLLRSLIEKGTLNPFIGSWLPNIIFAVIGMYLLCMASNERSTGFDVITRLFKFKKAIS